MRCREIAIYDRSQSPSLSGCLRENKSVPPSIILAEVHKVGNPVVAVPLTHVEAELHGSFMLLPLRPRNKKRAAHTPTRRRISAPTLSDPLRERRDARRRPLSFNDAWCFRWDFKNKARSSLTSFWKRCVNAQNDDIQKWFGKRESHYNVIIWERERRNCFQSANTTDHNSDSFSSAALYFWLWAFIFGSYSNLNITVENVSQLKLYIIVDL